ncbi:MAG: hypothetical protein AAFV87_16665 [Pseudomonadota bacterium]
MSFDQDGHLIEDGVHAEYQELWRRVASPLPTAMRVRAGPLSGVVIWSDTVFLLALGEPDAPSTSGILSALERGEQPEALSAHPWSGYTMGHWDGDIGIARLSTNPFCEGHPVLSRAEAGTFIAQYQDFEGRWQSMTLQADQSRK